MSYRIKDIPISERPRERFTNVGASNLSDSEILAIVLKTGTKNRNVMEIAIDILNNYKIFELENISISDLMKIKGIGETKSIELLAAIELGKRIFLKKDSNINSLNSPELIYKATKYIFNNLKQEHFYVLYFDNKKHLLGKKILFIGTINESTVHPREVFKTAYYYSASYIVCMHNHPSNDTTPSIADIRFTEQLIKVGKIQGIFVIDHIIVGSDNYYSFYEHGLMKEGI